MSELPRGWTYPALETGGVTPAAVSIPAIAGVSHVLASVEATLFGTVANYDPLIQILINGVLFTESFVVLTPANPGDFDLATWSFSGAVAAPPDQPIAVGFTAIAAGITETLIVQGYDF